MRLGEVGGFSEITLSQFQITNFSITMETGPEYDIPEAARFILLDAMEHLGRARVELRAAKSKLVY